MQVFSTVSILTPQQGSPERITITFSLIILLVVLKGKYCAHGKILTSHMGTVYA